jgi:pectate lyase
MPLYVLRCDYCFATTEVMVHRDSRDKTQLCGECSRGTMRRAGPHAVSVRSQNPANTLDTTSSRREVSGGIGIRIEDSEDVTIQGGSFTDMDTAVSVDNSRNVSIDGLQTWDVNTALEPTDSKNVRLRNATMHETDEK